MRLFLTEIGGDITGDAASITGSITTAQVTGLDAALAAKADDAAVVHKTGDESIDGDKTFSGFVKSTNVIASGPAASLVAARRDNGAAGFGLYSDAGELHFFNYTTNTISATIDTDHAVSFAGSLAVAGNLSAPVLATGTTTARKIEDRAADVIHCKDLGVTGDGEGGVDDTAAIQAWLDAVAAVGGKAAWDRPISYYKVTDTLLIRPPAAGAQVHMDMEGLSAFPEFVRWAGADNKPVFRVVGLKLSTIRNVNVQIPAGATGVIAWDLDNTGAAPSISELTFVNCRVDLGTGATSCHGWRLGHGTEWVTATDGEIDQLGDISDCVFLNCTVNGVETGGGNAAWRSEHQNVLNNTWIGGAASHVDFAITNIPSAGAAASGGKGGQSIWVKGFGTSHNLTDFELGTTGSYAFHACRFEVGTTLVKVPNAGSAAGMTILLSGVEIGGYDLAGGNVFDINSSVNLHLDAVTIYANATPFGPGLFKLASGAGVPGSLTLTNCLVAGTNPFHTITAGSGTWTVRREQCQTIDLSGLVTGTIDDGVYSTDSYSDPAWLASLAGSKVSGDISGNAASITGGIAESQVTNLTTDLAARAVKAANETIPGAWTFGADVNIDSSASTQAAVRQLAFNGGASTVFANRLALAGSAYYVQTGFGCTLQLGAYWGVQVSGNRQADAPAFASGGPSDPSLNVIGTTAAAAVLRATAAAGQSGNIIEAVASDGSTVLASVSATGGFSGDGSGLTGITESQVAGLTADLAAKAPIASPAFTGTARIDSHYGAIAASASGAFDLAVADQFSRTLDGTNGAITFANFQVGQDAKVELIQDATGGRVASWPTIRWSGGTAPTLATAGGKADLIVISKRPDGTLAGAVAIPNY